MKSIVSTDRRRVRMLSMLAVAVSLCCAAGVLAPRANAFAPQCGDHYSAVRNATNPLILSAAPGANPLNGGTFFVNGPKHGSAAGAIARRFGVDASTPPGSALPSFTDSESWATFAQNVSRTLGSLPSGVASEVRKLAKIASQPELQKVSIYSQGGGAGAIYSQTQKLFCHNFTADPGSVPIVMTYFLHPALGGCATPAQMRAATPAFERRVNELVAAIGNRPVVLLLEEDAYGSSACMSRHGDLGDWERVVRYEVDRASTLPHAVVYLEAGYSDSNSPTYTARALNHSDIGKIRGFFTNDTHINWTLNEIKWGKRISMMTHGADFIVNTAQNGNGPKLNGNRVKNGNEDLCNPPGRGLGPSPTTATGFSHVDAFLWTSVPGNSSGSCHGGPASGTFWTQRAIALAGAANNRLGPHSPSAPY